jgi:hypothetical protein
MVIDRAEKPSENWSSERGYETFDAVAVGFGPSTPA